MSSEQNNNTNPLAGYDGGFHFLGSGGIVLVPYCACYIHTPRLVQLGGSIQWDARTYFSLPTAQCGVDWVGMCTAHSYIPQKELLV